MSPESAHTSCREGGRRGQARLALSFIVAAIASLATPAHAQRVLTVLAYDTALVSPPSIPAGIVTVRLVLKGKTRRDLVVHRVPASTTPKSLVQEGAGRHERWFARGSFSGPAVPRDSAADGNVTLDLRPGRYALVSYEVDAAGRPRPDRYLWAEVVVAATSVLIPARFPMPDVSIKIRDKGIAVSGAVRTGQRVLEVENAGSRAHELIIGRLLPGKTVDDVVRWDRAREGAPPYTYVGGLVPMAPALTVQTRLLLQSGTHVVLCPTRPASDRDHPHVASLVASFVVR